MLLVAAVLVSLATVPLAGGRLSALAETRLRWVPAIYGSLALQALTAVAPGDGAGHRVAHVVSYLFAGAFVVANRHLAGVPIVAAGGLCNFAAILANGGVMPASPAALRAAGLAEETSGFSNSAAVAHPRFGFLGDVFAIPEAWPLHNIFSIGDVLIAVGVAVAVHTCCGSRLTSVPGRLWRVVSRP